MDKVWPSFKQTPKNDEAAQRRLRCRRQYEATVLRDLISMVCVIGR